MPCNITTMYIVVYLNLLVKQIGNFKRTFVGLYNFQGVILVFYNNLKEECDRQGLKITPIVLECGGNKGSLSGWKKGASPNSDIVAKLAVRLNVSTDLLIFGKENQSNVLTDDEQKLLENYNKLTDTNKEEVLVRAKELANGTDSEEDSDKQRLLKMYDLLTPMEKGEILGELKAMTKKRNPDIHIQTVRIVARSTDDTPPRMVTGDFSDILNAPDATDEY